VDLSTRQNAKSDAEKSIGVGAIRTMSKAIFISFSTGFAVLGLALLLSMFSVCEAWSRSLCLYFPW
jgi:hypothetical protein